MKESAKKNEKFHSFERIVSFCIGKKRVVYVICIMLAVLALFCTWNTNVNSSRVAYLPSGTSSGAGYEIMTSEFTDLASARVLLDNVSMKQCEYMQEALSEIDGVYAVDFDADSYEDGVGILDVTFAYSEGSEAEASFEAVKAATAAFDGGVSSDMDTGWWWNIDFGVIFLAAAAVLIIIVALVYASRTYADIWVMLITLVLAVILNYGASFGMSKVTALTAGLLHSVLTMYYTALICRRYTKERKELEVRPAVIAAVTGSMPKIIAGAVIASLAFLALAFSKLHIGSDFAVAMVKGILFTVILCITLLPCLITTFAKRMEKSRHRALLPKIKNRGRLTFKTRFVFPIIFAVLAIASLAFVVVNPVEPYAYGGEQLMPLIKSQGQTVEYIAGRDFDKDTSVVYMIVPANNYNAEKQVVREVENMVDVVSVTALSNSSAASYILTDEINIWQFSDITGLDETAVWNIYSDYSELIDVEAAGGIEAYEVPFIDIFKYTYDRIQSGSLTVDSLTEKTFNEINYELLSADLQLHGEAYDRIIIETALSEEPAEAVELIDDIRAVGELYYGNTVYITGDSGAISDMADAYHLDLIVVTAITVVLLFAVFAVMFKTVGLAAVMVLMVQGGVWLGMAVPYIIPGKLIHIGSMPGYTLQMLTGVTYAAAIVNSYRKFKKNSPLKKAIGQAIKENYSLIVITGCLLILSGIVLGLLSFDEAVMATGFSITVGGVINMLLALCVIPQSLLALDIVESRISKTGIDITGEAPPPVEERMDIVEAIEKLKSAEQQSNETIIPEKEGEQQNETEK